MSFPLLRPRRLRQSSQFRSLVAETSLSSNDFIVPVFIVPGTGVKNHISSLPGQYQFSVDTLLEEVKELSELGLKALMLFGIPDTKDEEGLVACHDDGIVQSAIRVIKDKFPNILLIADLCFCEYTTHGHCGVLTKSGELDNDKTLNNLALQAVSLSKAGADMLAPSGMLDGMVMAIREGLDENGFSALPIMSYSAKYSSAWYGPFRDAVNSSPSFGDRKSYQMNPANIREALKEVRLDIEEGADIVMVKPALSYLDVILAVKNEIDVPLAAYNVSGEYAMIKLAAREGLIDGEALMMESLLSIKRAGADMIISYFAKEVCRRL